MGKQTSLDIFVKKRYTFSEWSSNKQEDEVI